MRDIWAAYGEGQPNARQVLSDFLAESGRVTELVALGGVDVFYDLQIMEDGEGFGSFGGFDPTRYQGDGRGPYSGDCYSHTPSLSVESWSGDGTGSGFIGIIFPGDGTGKGRKIPPST